MEHTVHLFGFQCVSTRTDEVFHLEICFSGFSVDNHLAIKDDDEEEESPEEPLISSVCSFS